MKLRCFHPKRFKSSCLLAAACICLQAQEPSSSTSRVTQVLDAVRDHVQRLETSVPDFICKEEIVSEMFDKQKLKRKTEAEATLTTTRTTKEGRGVFSESRAGMKINGKPTRRNEIDGPFVWQGGPAYGDLHNLFNSDEGRRCRSFKLLGEVDFEGRKALLIKTSAARVPSEGFACTNLPQDSSDQIWLDPATLNVIRIESYDPPVTPVPGAVITLTVEYMPVSFDAVEYWLPAHFTSRLDFPGTPKQLLYDASFSDYHKYGAESVIHIDGAQ